jgi:hypothetical protein
MWEPGVRAEKATLKRRKKKKKEKKKNERLGK